MNRKYDVCVFDLDGTLADSLKDLAASCDASLALFDLPCHTLDEYRFFVGNGILNLIKNAMGEKAEDEKLLRSVYGTFNMIYEEKCLDNTHPYHGVTDLLTTLKDSGVKIGVLSNKADDFAKHIVGALFDSRLIDAVYGQRDEFPKKPQPDSLYAMLDELGCERERCLYIGDSDVDVITAKNGGVDFCGVEWGFRGYDELHGAGAETIVRKAGEIADIVLK